MNDLMLQQPDKQVPATLPALAEKINAEHRQAETALNDGLRHALEAGRLLSEAKAKVSHGEWLPWLEINFHGTKRTARAYMLVAARLPQLEKQNGNGVANLSFREALRLSAPPQRDKAEPAAKNLHDYYGPVDEQLLAAIPDLSPDQELYAIPAQENPSYFCEVYPSIKHPGFFHLVIHEDLDTDNASVVYDRRGVRYDRRLLAFVLGLHGHMPLHWGSRPASGQEFWALSAPGKPAPGRVGGGRRQ